MKRQPSRTRVPFTRRRHMTTSDECLCDLHAENVAIRARISELSRQRDRAVDENDGLKRELRVRDRIIAEGDRKYAWLEANYTKTLARVRELEHEVEAAKVPIPVIWNPTYRQYECGDCGVELDGYDEPNFCPHCGAPTDWVRQEPKGIEYADWALDAARDGGLA